MNLTIASFEKFMKDYRIAHPGNVDQASRVLRAAIVTLLAENDRLRERLGPLADPLCLLCGEKAPCMTEAEALANGGPGVPCTFDPTPKQLWEAYRFAVGDKEKLGRLLHQAYQALSYHQEQTRPIDKTLETLQAIKQALESHGVPSL